MEARKVASPFLHAVLDGWFPANLVGKAADDWPGDGWDGWFRYDSPLERKAVCNSWKVMPLSCATLLNLMTALPPWAGLFPDASLWGAGMCSMKPGDHLDLHLDADHHPKAGWIRRASMVLFLGDWQDEWGGRLELWDGNERPSGLSISVEPAPGRLVWFEEGYHAVSPITGPEVRKSLSLFWYSLPEAHRPRARFVGFPGENDPEKDKLRQERSK